MPTKGFLFSQRPWRGGRVVEGAPLLREYTSKAYRGFESHPLRHFGTNGKFRTADFPRYQALSIFIVCGLNHPPPLEAMRFAAWAPIQAASVRARSRIEMRPEKRSQGVLRVEKAAPLSAYT